MKDLLISMLVVVLIVAAAKNFKTDSKENLSLSQLVNLCQKSGSAQKDCDPIYINDLISNQVKADHAGRPSKFIVQTTDGEFVDLTSGDLVKLNLNGLTSSQINIWESWKSEKKSESKTKEFSFMDDKNIGILIIVAFGIIAVLVIPFAWRFILNRISEVAKAVKGEKF